MPSSWDYASLAGKLAELGALDAAQNALDIASQREKWEAEALRRQAELKAERTRRPFERKTQSRGGQERGITSEYVLDLLRSGTPSERRNFLSKLPPCNLSTFAAHGFSSGNDDAVLTALSGVIHEYCAGINAEIGVVLAEAAHRRAVELWQADPHEHGGLLAVTLSGLAHSHVKALGLLGRYEEQIAAADRYIEMYGVRPLVASLPRLRPEALIAEPPTTAHVVFEPKNLRLLRLARIEALIGLRRIDEANSALNADPALLNDPIAGFEANRLRNQLIQVMQDPRKPKWQGTNAPAPLSGEALIKGLREILRDEFEGEQKESLLAAVDRLDPNNHLDPTDPDQRALAEEMKTAAEAYLTEGTRPDLEILFRHAEELSSKLKK